MTRHNIIKNILDEQIPGEVTSQLPKPLIPGKSQPSPPPRKRKEQKRKAIVREFDPNTSSRTFRTLADYQKEVLELFENISAKKDLTFHQTPWVLANYLRGWQMDVPQSSDPRAFLERVRPQIQEKLQAEVETLKGVKFQLALKVQLLKDKPDGVEYTDPVLRHKQEVILQAIEISKALDKVFPHMLETLEKWTQRGSGWMVDTVQTLWLDIARYQPLKGGSYIQLPAALRNKKAIVNVKNKDDHCLR